MAGQLNWISCLVCVLVFLSGADISRAEGTVEFEDAELKNCVELELGKDNPTAEDMLKLERIGYSGPLAPQVSIKSLKGLEYASNLKYLYLSWSSIQDFSILSQLTELEELGLKDCDISDITPIVSAIKSLNKLKQISLRYNQISDISPLARLKTQTLKWIDLKGNPLNEDAYKMVIPQLRKNIKGVQIFTPFQTVQLVMPAIFFVLFVITGILLIIHYRKQKGWIFEILYGLLSAWVGCFLGSGAQILYEDGELFSFGNGYENPMWVGGVAGGVFGLLVGLWFAQFLRGLRAKGSRAGGIIGKGILTGIGLGMLCSTAVHIILVIAYRGTNLTPMLIGLCFGALAGFVAGLVLSVVFVLINRTALSRVKETA